jgi:phytoene synthase
MQALSADGEVLSTAADLVDCRRLLRTGSRSFHAASRLLPRQLRDAACGLYAFCREADDAVDEGGDPQRALVHLRQRLDAIYRPSAASGAVDRAFAAVVARHGLPRELPDALLEGFAWDAEARSYEDLDGVLAYAARVAGSVGVMMALLMGRRDPVVLARAADLGVAMQLTNIARDVGEDARAGRLYLPRDWLREAGIDPRGFLAGPVHSEALAGVVRRLLTVADTLYRRADSGLAQLPLGARPAMYAARLLYAAIGAELARRGHDAVTSRSVVPGPVKLRLLLKVPLLLASRGEAPAVPALAQTRFLLDAVRRQPAPPVPSTSSAGPLAQAERNINWVLDLFAELERRDREQPIRLPVRRTRVSLRQP